MIYLIGGPPKCGKTTLTKKLSKELQIPWISTDALQVVAMAYLSKVELQKKFPWSEVRKKTHRINDELYNNYQPKQIIKLYRTAAKSTYPALDAICASKVADGINYILEGLHIEPKFAAQLIKKFGRKNITAIFLVKKDEKSFIKNIEKSSTPNDWIIAKTKERKLIYPKIAKMICAYGTVIEKEAREYGFRCMVLDGDFKKQLQKAIKLL